jgi:TM2 domain-containing membrane protein YozV
MTDDRPPDGAGGRPPVTDEQRAEPNEPTTTFPVGQQPANQAASGIAAPAASHEGRPGAPPVFPHAVYAYDPRTGLPVGPPITYPGYPHGPWPACGPVAMPPINIVVQNTNSPLVPYGPGGIVRDGNRTRGAAALLAFFFGGFGIHKFYLGQPGMGFLYLVFCWTFIPFIAGYFEAVGYLLMSDRAFDLKYNARLV